MSAIFRINIFINISWAFYVSHVCCDKKVSILISVLIMYSALSSKTMDNVGKDEFSINWLLFFYLKIVYISVSHHTASMKIRFNDKHKIYCGDDFQKLFHFSY